MTELVNNKTRRRRSEDVIYKEVLEHLLQYPYTSSELRSEAYLMKRFNLSWIILMRMVKQGLLNIDFQKSATLYYADNRNKKAAETACWCLKGGSTVKSLTLPNYPVYLAKNPIKKTTVNGIALSIIGVRMERVMMLLGTVKTPLGEVFMPWTGRTPLPISAYVEAERNTNNVVGVRRKCKVIDIWGPVWC